jgi:hypothetical protein
MAKKVIGGLIGIGLFLGLSIYIYELTNNKLHLGYNQNYAPEQPIPFEHSLHAGTYKIQCQYCHSNVSVSMHSSIPALNVCMNCHIQVKTDSPWIAKIRDAYNSGGSVQWVKVHMLPDFVHFNHKRHIAAGKQCADCHGPVETMSRVYQHADLSMGWCIDCHRKPENNAPTTCSTCHY